MIKHGNLITVAMITLNEEASIRKVVEDIWKIDKRIEVLIVDSSTDNTAKIAKQIGVKVIKQFPPKGYGPAMDLALKSCDRDVIITMDCDDTYPTDEIELFSSKIMDEKFDLVEGDRLEKKPENMPTINFLANYFFALIASFLFFKRIRDLHSGMRAYRKSIITSLPYNPNGVSLPVELLLWPIRLNYKIYIKPIKYKERIGQSKLEPLKAAYWTVIRILRARFIRIKK
jgi:glycosyltransferase involved in cell wall biosynthesis